jgi:hypothetical protein
MAKATWIALLAAFVSFAVYRYPDFVVVLLPKYIDGHFIRLRYDKSLKNTGITHFPFISQIIPETNITVDNLRDIFDPNGFPRVVKNIIHTDQDKIMNILARDNAGKMLRTFTGLTDLHFSPSCGKFRTPHSEPFDTYARSHMFSNVSWNHTLNYAGFESITDAETVAEITGLDVTQLADYRLNNLFTSNLPRELITATLHCAPIDSLTLQLVGTKTWIFVSPDDLTNYPNIPMPTFFNLPMTDDELLSKVKKLYVVKQQPGDAMYFGPNWCHAVSTSAGPNLMFNMRYNNIPLVKKSPKSLLFKIYARFALGRAIGGLPQENRMNFPIIYDEINEFFKDCGPSEAFSKIYKKILEVAK